MQEEHDQETLTRAVPTHLFQFEEKVFGMTLSQMLTDLCALLLLLAGTSGMELVPRIVLCVSVFLVVLLLVHGTRDGQTFVRLLFLSARALTIPAHTVWRPSTKERKRGEPASVQQTWIPLQSLNDGIMGDAGGNLWVIFEVESLQQVRYLPTPEQARMYRRWKRFLDGLSFPLKCLTLVAPIETTQAPALVQQREALTQHAQGSPLHRLHQASLTFQQEQASGWHTTRHFVVVGATPPEVAQTKASARPALGSLLWKRAKAISPEEVRDLLRERVSVVEKALRDLQVEARLLTEAAALSAFAACLAPGMSAPSFTVEVALHPTKAMPRAFTKRIRGRSASCTYTSAHPAAHISPGEVDLADLLAPSRVSITRDAVAITVGQQTQVQRYFEITDYPAELPSGWQAKITELGLPMLLVTRYDPIPRRVMRGKLELDLLKLESHRLTNEKTRRRTRTHEQVAAEQIQSVVGALERGQLSIAATSVTIGLSAPSQEELLRCEHFLRAHLRDMQVGVRACTARMDAAWQASLPTMQATGLEHLVNLPSTVLQAFLSMSSALVGTSLGAFLGWTGTGESRRPVYFNPWDTKKKLANPHLVIIGDTGSGKSLACKTLITGLIEAGIADVVVLDRDGDYDELHSYLQGQSQRISLSGGCPINLLEIPYGPADVDEREVRDLLSEFTLHRLLVGLALLYGEAFSTPAASFLAQVIRATYAEAGITSEAILRDPDTLLRPAPVFADLLAMMQTRPCFSEEVRLSLLARFEQVAYLFSGQTTLSLTSPLTIFNVAHLDEQWYPLMTYVVQTFLERHRALRSDERYLAFVIEEASYLLKHPAGRRFLEQGARGFRKRGIAQIVLSQHPAEFLEEGEVVLANAGSAIYLGMSAQATAKLGLSEELARILEVGVPGQAVMRCGREIAPLTIATSQEHYRLFTTDPAERRALRALTPSQQKGGSHHAHTLA